MPCASTVLYIITTLNSALPDGSRPSQTVLFVHLFMKHFVIYLLCARDWGQGRKQDKHRSCLPEASCLVRKTNSVAVKHIMKKYKMPEK